MHRQRPRWPDDNSSGTGSSFSKGCRTCSSRSGSRGSGSWDATNTQNGNKSSIDVLLDGLTALAPDPRTVRVLDPKSAFRWTKSQCRLIFFCRSDTYKSGKAKKGSVLWKFQALKRGLRDFRNSGPGPLGVKHPTNAQSRIPSHQLTWNLTFGGVPLKGTSWSLHDPLKMGKTSTTPRFWGH